MTKISVIFVCTHNSCRSQISAGILNKIYKNSPYSIDKHVQFSVTSSGLSSTKQIKPLAIEVCKEIGVDISSAPQTILSDHDHTSYNVVVTTCTCSTIEFPAWQDQPNVRYENWKDVERSGDGIEAFRNLREQIQTKCQTLFHSLMVTKLLI